MREDTSDSRVALLFMRGEWRYAMAIMSGDQSVGKDGMTRMLKWRALNWVTPPLVSYYVVHRAS